MSQTDETQPATGSVAELEAVQARMAEIKAQVSEELIRDWPSPWKAEAMVAAKVTGRLGGNKEFQGLLKRKRELQESLDMPDAPRQLEDAVDPMGSYANRLSKGEDPGMK